MESDLTDALRTFAGRSDTEKPSGRERALNAAAKAVLKDRNRDYANPEDNFRHTAIIANAVFEAGRIPIRLTPWAVGVVLEAVKMARLGSSPHVEDHYVDGIGYWACLNDMRPGTADEERAAVTAMLRDVWPVPRNPNDALDID